MQIATTPSPDVLSQQKIERESQQKGQHIMRVGFSIASVFTEVEATSAKAIQNNSITPPPHKHIIAENLCYSSLLLVINQHKK
jgi:hypothetical protein